MSDNKVYFSLNPETFFCDSVEAIAYQLPGYPGESYVTITYLKGEIVSIHIELYEKTIYAPFDFDIDSQVLEELFILHLTSNKCLCRL